MKYSFTIILLVCVFACRSQNKLAYTCGDDQLKTLLRKIDSGYDRM